MKRYGATLAVLFALLPAAAFAQGTTDGTKVPALRTEKTIASVVVQRLAKESGALIVVDKTVAGIPMTFDTIGGAVPDVLKQLVALLPPGTTVKKTYLPAPGASTLSGDVVALQIATEEALAKVEGEKGSTPDAIRIMGKSLTPEKAQSVITTLDLKPVYLVTNPSAGDDPVQKMLMAQTDAIKNWMTMTPEQRDKAADQQFDSLLNMDPATRKALIGQQMQAAGRLMTRMQTLPEAQRNQLMNDFKGAMPQPPKPPQSGGGAP